MTINRLGFILPLLFDILSIISQSTIAKIENGKINPSLNNIFKILHAMGKTIKIASL